MSIASRFVVNRAKKAAAKGAEKAASKAAPAPKPKAKKPLAAKPKTKAPAKAKPAPRGMVNTPDLHALDTQAAITAARQEPHLMQDKSGQFIGAPRGDTTREQIEANRRAFD